MISFSASSHDMDYISYAAYKTEVLPIFGITSLTSNLLRENRKPIDEGDTS